MYESVCLSDLMEMAELADGAERFFMHQFMDACRTAGCLAGTWCLAHQNDALTINGSGVPQFRGIWGSEAVAARFRIAWPVARFLFTSHSGLSHNPRQAATNAQRLGKVGAIARLRKYISYVQRKRSLWAEHEWLMGLSRADRRARLEGARQVEVVR